MLPYITMLLLNYRRPENIPAVIDSIRSQTVPAHIFLWNNGGRSPADWEVDWAIDSSHNSGCWVRWFMGTYAQTEFVCSIDDDLAFASNDALHTLLTVLDAQDDARRVVGAEGVVLMPDQPYYNPEGNQGRHIKWPKEDRCVDIVKGRLLACRREVLEQIPFSGRLREDDIALCGTLAGREERFHLVTGALHGKLRDLPEGESAGNFRQPEHLASREQARRLYFHGR